MDDAQAQALQDAEDAIVDGLAARFNRKQLSAMLDDARGLENAGRSSNAWEQMADLLWAAYARREH